jgi:hypothetical protein
MCLDTTSATNVSSSNATAAIGTAMDSENPSLDRLRHKPVFLIPYAAHDGPHAGATDCLFLSLGWAQYDPRSASLKALRYSGSKWSRQSEELPLHRAVDLVIVLARAIRHMLGPHLNTVDFPAHTFENQVQGMVIEAGGDTVAEGDAFGREITSELVRRRLGELRDVLNELHTEGKI